MNPKKLFYKYVFICVFLLPSISSGGEYAVRFNKGDTIYKIAREHSVPPEILIKMNGIKDPTKIKAGSSIKIPFVYSIQTGDTLTSICKKYRITQENVFEYNSIPDKEKLEPGVKLYLLIDNEYFNSDSESKENADSLAWPLSGKKERLKGKLSGAIIYGKAGDAVLSVAYGIVIWAGPYRGYQKMLLIKSDTNCIYLYAGNEKILVKVGDHVKKEDSIGVLGESSHDGNAKAIFCMYLGKKALDPFTAKRE